MTTSSGWPSNRWAAVILTGGTARRLGGVDKATLEVGGRTLIERSLSAVADATEVVVVGEPVQVTRSVRFVREQPAYGGPAAAVAAGLRAAEADPVVVLAVDLPFLTPASVARLLDSMGGHDGAVLVDGGGRRQLAFAVRRAALAAVPPETTEGLPLWKLLDPLDLVEVPAIGAEARDIDTWVDLEACGAEVDRRNLGS